MKATVPKNTANKKYLNILKVVPVLLQVQD